jgi:protein-S-isoprenylcysteine O-methyltransferase Ste14
MSLPLRRLLGAPTIHPVPFWAAKLAVLVTWALLGLGLLGVDLGSPPSGSRAVAAILAAGGAGIALTALATLGPSARVGLPREETELRTGGIYRFSRHPTYVGLFLTCAASTLCTLHWAAAASSVVTVVLHHRIALAEESFLERRFGAAWLEYEARVRRYV